MKKRKLFLYSLFIVTGLITTLFFQKGNPVQESITFFPLDSETSFVEADTSLFLYDQKDEDEYVLKWNINSDLGKKVYLRQDIGFLFSDGLLIHKASKWEESSQQLHQSKKVSDEDSGHYQAITYHQGEIHYEDELIKSSQRMSYDQLYVIDSPKSALHSFKKPSTKGEEEWKKVLDHATMQQLKFKWAQLAEHYQIPVEKYTMIPLTSLAYYNSKPLPGLTLEETQSTIGKLWEGLYKNYFLGLKKQDGSTESSLGSTIPLLLINSNHLLVLFQSASGEYYQLIQYIRE